MSQTNGTWPSKSSFRGEPRRRGSRAGNGRQTGRGCGPGPRGRRWRRPARLSSLSSASGISVSAPAPEAQSTLDRVTHTFVGYGIDRLTVPEWPR